MKYIIGKDRSQFEMFCLEERIPQENEVRLIDLFVDSLPLEKYVFVEKNKNTTSTKLSTNLGVTGLSSKHAIEAI